MPHSMIRRERPPGLRFRVGELVPIASRGRSGGGQQKRRTRPDKAFHFNLARPQADEKQGESTYVIDPVATDALKRRIPEQEGPFEPTRIPIILLSAKPTGDDHHAAWYEARLYCHATSCTSDQIIPDAGTFEEKSLEHLRSEDQHRALEAQGLQYIIGDEPDYEGHPELFEGMATRYDADASGHKRPHRVKCDPLLCKQFRHPDAKQACGPMGRIAFGIEWCPGRWYGSFVHGSWRSTSRMLSTLAEVAEIYASKGRNLSRAQVWFCTEPVMTTAPDGKRYKQPCEHFEPDLEWLAAEIKALADETTYREALPQISIEAVDALPSLSDLMSDRAERREIMSLHQPEIHAEIVDAEEAVWGRFSDYITRTVFEAALTRYDGDLEGLEKHLKQYAPDQPVKSEPEEPELPAEPEAPTATEDVIDAEFTEDDEPEEAPAPQPDPEPAPEVDPWEGRMYEKLIAAGVKESIAATWIQDGPDEAAVDKRLENALKQRATNAAKKEQTDEPTEPAQQGGLPGTEE